MRTSKQFLNWLVFLAGCKRNRLATLGDNKLVGGWAATCKDLDGALLSRRCCSNFTLSFAAAAAAPTRHRHMCLLAMLAGAPCDHQPHCQAQLLTAAGPCGRRQEAGGCRVADCLLGDAVAYCQAPNRLGLASFMRQTAGDIHAHAWYEWYNTHRAV